ncbi:MAG: nucleoside deaminase [Firmicutes bacterium]|nr:nucleoside deaminase [Bacillota bacterium]
MNEALKEAHKALAKAEVPIGAVIVYEGKIIARAHNQREKNHDATAHAEILALRKAGEVLGGWRLIGTTLYVTIEPCPMCAGALVQARVSRLVYGAADPKAGAAGTLCNLVDDERFNHRLEVTGGVLEKESKKLMQDFFRSLRRAVQ